MNAFAGGQVIFMMKFQKQDLAGNHYHWTEEEAHLYTGQPSRRIFDRFNGYQVLFLINFYASLSEKLTLREGRTIEQKIQHELPDGIKSEVAVFNWIRNIAFTS